MNKPPSRTAQADAPTSSAAQPKRRRLVVGAGVAAGAALAAAALRQPGQATATVAAAKPDATATDGYRLTEHIRRYYDTTRT